MIKFGKISQSDPETCRVRVDFPDDEIVSFWLPLVVQGSAGNKYFNILDVGTPVACAMDERNENGVCLGAIYTKETAPAGGGPDITAVTFSDGTLVQYDRAASELTVNIETTEFIISPAGFSVSRGGESLKAIVADILAAIKLQTHTTSTGPSGPPINLAAFTAIETRLPNLLP